MLVRLYKSCWARIYVFSPSVDVDSAWLPVKKYVEDGLKVDPKKEKCFYSEWDPAALQDIVDGQRKLTEFCKENKQKKLHGICIVVDDFADDPKIMHAAGGAAAGGSMLNTLFVRGRHLQISTLVSSQKFRLVVDNPCEFTIPLRLEAAEPARAREFVGGGFGRLRQENVDANV